MDGKAIKLLKYLDGSDKRFIIPVYQRNYSWKVENCRQLYDDLVKLIRKKRKLHFFGSLVSVYNGIQEEFLIIDGQQRVTTISLLLLAMHNILKEKKLIAKDNRLIDKIFEEYLVDKYAPSEKRIKLKAVNKDLEAFEKLFDEEPSLKNCLTRNLPNTFPILMLPSITNIFMTGFSRKKLPLMNCMTRSVSLWS